VVEIQLKTKHKYHANIAENSLLRIVY